MLDGGRVVSALDGGTEKRGGGGGLMLTCKRKGCGTG